MLSYVLGITPESSSDVRCILSKRVITISVKYKISVENRRTKLSRKFDLSEFKSSSSIDSLFLLHPLK